MRGLAIGISLVLGALSGCAGSTVKEFEIHVGWNEDGQSQYMRPSAIRVEQGDRVRFVVYNDDDPNRDYNGDKPGKDNFHDVALLDYDGNGDGVTEDIEHEAPAGREAPRTTLDGHDYFTAATQGAFRIICEVRTTPPHEQLGMKATFFVH